MSSLFHTLLIPISLVAIAVTLKSSGTAIYRKKVEFRDIDEHIQAEIEKSFAKTLTRLADFEMDLPAKIVIHRMENEKGNTFNDPFLVGNSHEIRASHYVSDPVADWCSGVVSRYTRHYFEHKNRRIDVTFDCNRKMVIPPLRTIVGWILVLLFANAAFVVFRLAVLRLETHLCYATETKNVETAISASIDEKPISMDDYIIDDDVIENLVFMESVEKWDSSKLESCYD